MRTRLFRFCSGIFILPFLFSNALSQNVLVGAYSDYGLQGGGTTFSVLTSGANFNVDHMFTNRGERPMGQLIKGTDGNFYGMTNVGGVTKQGTIFKLTPSGVVTILKSLDTSSGYYPSGSLVQGKDGAFYGITNTGGAGYGTIFKITSTGSFTVLKRLDRKSGGPNSQQAQLTLGTDGNFYTIMPSGGAFLAGTIIKMTTAGVVTVLKNIDSARGPSPGYLPHFAGDYGCEASLMQASDGNLYGITNYLGKHDVGFVFRVTTSGAFTMLSSLDGYTGTEPWACFMEASDGNFYGWTTVEGTHKRGTIYKLTKVGVITVLMNFDPATTGAFPVGPPVQGNDGYLYGVTNEDERKEAGAVFKVNTSGVYSIIHHFKWPGEGSKPGGGLYNNKDGFFYGMTTLSDSISNNELGSFYKISYTGVYTNIKLANSVNGYYPNAGLIQAANGFYYGTTSAGGASNYGAIYRTCRDRSFQTIYSFSGFALGTNPIGKLTQAEDGNLYGVTSSGGSHGYGVIYKCTVAGVYSVLKNLDLTTGYYSLGLMLAKDGSLYGAAQRGGSSGNGTIFKITTAGVYSVLKNLTTTTGAHPQVGLVQGTDGNFYGSTFDGGSQNRGTVFKITPAGVLTVLINLNTDVGTVLAGPLIQARDGNFYGIMNDEGGGWGVGTFFKITPSGVVTHSEVEPLTGFGAAGSLVEAPDGKLYGMMSYAYSGDGLDSYFFSETLGGSYTLIDQLRRTAGGYPTGALVLQKPTPLVVSQSVTMRANTTKKIKVSSSFGSDLMYSIVNSPYHGQASVKQDTITYTPLTGYTGADSIAFNVTWGCQHSVIGKIRLQVTAAAAAEINSMVLSASPIPSSTEFTLHFTTQSKEELTLTVYDATGRIIDHKDHLSSGTIKLGGAYEKGLYFAKLRQGTQVRVIKLIKRDN